MSILIKGMEMPTSCLECRLYNDPWCMAKNRNQWRTAYNRPPKGERQNDCPLVPVPPHGDLIDRREAIIDANERAYDFWLSDDEVNATIQFLKEQPTVIEAEEES